MIISNSYTRKDISFSHDQRLLQPLSGPLKGVNDLKEAFDYLKIFTIVKYDVTKTELKTLLVSLTDYSFSKHVIDLFLLLLVMETMILFIVRMKELLVLVK